MSMLITAATVVTGSEILRPGWIEVDGRTVVGLGPGEPPRALTDADVADRSRSIVLARRSTPSPAAAAAIVRWPVNAVSVVDSGQACR